MALEDTLKTLIKAAMKNHDEVARDVLRVVLGQIQLESSGQATSEDQKLHITRKLIKSNQQTLSSMAEQPRADWSPEWSQNAIQLEREIIVLEQLLPTSWSAEQVEQFVREREIDVRGPAAEGQAIGAVMKQLKADGAPAPAQVVKDVVTRLRAVQPKS